MKKRSGAGAKLACVEKPGWRCGTKSRGAGIRAVLNRKEKADSSSAFGGLGMTNLCGSTRAIRFEPELFSRNSANPDRRGCGLWAAAFGLFGDRQPFCAVR